MAAVTFDRRFLAGGEVIGDGEVIYTIVLMTRVYWWGWLALGSATETSPPTMAATAVRRDHAGNWEAVAFKIKA